jgi:hypothetical protein
VRVSRRLRSRHHLRQRSRPRLRSPRRTTSRARSALARRVRCVRSERGQEPLVLDQRTRPAVPERGRAALRSWSSSDPLRLGRVRDHRRRLNDRCAFRDGCARTTTSGRRSRPGLRSPRRTTSRARSALPRRGRCARSVPGSRPPAPSCPRPGVGSASLSATTCSLRRFIPFSPSSPSTSGLASGLHCRTGCPPASMRSDPRRFDRLGDPFDHRSLERAQHTRRANALRAREVVLLEERSLGRVRCPQVVVRAQPVAGTRTGGSGVGGDRARGRGGAGPRRTTSAALRVPTQPPPYAFSRRERPESEAVHDHRADLRLESEAVHEHRADLIR